MITKANIREIFRELDKALKAAGETREITIFGSGALMSKNILSRETIDVDIVDPAIDNTLQLISADVGEKYGLDFGWLNSAGHIFSRNFPEGWKNRTEVSYQGKNLTVKTLHRKDLVATKLNAACQRGLRDIDDLVDLKPTASELKFAKAWVLEREKSPNWPGQVDAILDELKKK